MENKRYNIELEVVTPLCVGAGGENDWVKGADYVQKGGKVYVIDLKRVYDEGIDINQLSDLLLNPKENEKEIVKLLGKRIEKVSTLSFDMPKDLKDLKDIKTFQRSQLHNVPLVAGSSLKGAIRSALFHKYYIEDNSIKEKIEEAVFGKIDNNVMSCLQVGDIELTSKTELINTKIFNLFKPNGDNGSWSGGWKKGNDKKKKKDNNTTEFNPTYFNTIYECATKGNKGKGRIVFVDKTSNDKNEKKDLFRQKKKNLFEGGLTELFSIINDNTRDYLLKELEFFKYYKEAERIKEIIKCIEDLLKCIPSDNMACLLKMSVGTGFHPITGNWQSNNYVKTVDEMIDGKRFKSRKIADAKEGLQLMGFVLLHDVEAENKKKQEQDRVVREQKEQELQKRNQFNALLQQAREFYYAKAYDRAIDTTKQALLLLPEDNGAKSLLEQLQKAKEVDEHIKSHNEAAEKAREQRLSQPLSTVLEGKTSVGNIIGTTKSWLKQEGHAIGQAEMDVMVNALLAFPQKEIQKKSGQMKKDLGEEVASQLLERMKLQ